MKQFITFKDGNGETVICNKSHIAFVKHGAVYTNGGAMFKISKEDEPNVIADITESDDRLLRVLRDIYELLRARLH